MDEEPEDWTYACKVEKDGKIKIANLGTNLHQMSYEHIGQLAAKLSLVAGIVEQVWLSKKAQDTLGAMTQGDEADLLPFFKKHKADKIVETIRAKVAAAMGEADPKHGKSTPRRERSIADYIDVRPVPPDANPEDEEHEYDAAIDGGLTNGPQARR